MEIDITGITKEPPFFAILPILPDYCINAHRYDVCFHQALLYHSLLLDQLL
jgi:hypothetical protein